MKLCTTWLARLAVASQPCSCQIITTANAYQDSTQQSPIHIHIPSCIPGQQLGLWIYVFCNVMMKLVDTVKTVVAGGVWLNHSGYVGTGTLINYCMCGSSLVLMYQWVDINIDWCACVMCVTVCFMAQWKLIDYVFVWKVCGLHQHAMCLC